MKRSILNGLAFLALASGCASSPSSVQNTIPKLIVEQNDVRNIYFRGSDEGYYVVASLRQDGSNNVDVRVKEFSPIRKNSLDLTLHFPSNIYDIESAQEVVNTINLNFINRGTFGINYDAGKNTIYRLEAGLTDITSNSENGFSLNGFSFD